MSGEGSSEGGQCWWRGCQRRGAVEELAGHRESSRSVRRRRERFGHHASLAADPLEDRGQTSLGTLDWSAHDEQMVQSLVGPESHCHIRCGGLTWRAPTKAGERLGIRGTWGSAAAKGPHTSLRELGSNRPTLPRQMLRRGRFRWLQPWTLDARG